MVVLCPPPPSSENAPYGKSPIQRRREGNETEGGREGGSGGGGRRRPILGDARHPCNTREGWAIAGVSFSLIARVEKAQNAGCDGSTSRT